MRNLMQPEALKLAMYIAGILASPAVILAAIKMVLFFGKLSSAVDQLLEFAKTATHTLGDHDGRLRVIEDRLEISR